jgi:hypothetical protein
MEDEVDENMKIDQILESLDLMFSWLTNLGGQR